MRIFLLGNKNRAVECLEVLQDEGHEIVGVVAPPSSGVEDWYPSLADVAAEDGIDVHRPTDVNDPSFLDTFENASPDLGVMAGYNQILGAEVLSVPKHGVINLHAGKLPEYRGASTLNWMIINGESEGGVAIHYVDEGIDTGDVILQRSFPIAIDDTIADIVARTDELFPEMLVETVDRIVSGNVDVTPQSRTDGAYYHSRVPRDGEILWDRQTAREVYDLIRALTDPYPGAFTTCGGERLFVWGASLLDETIRGMPGRVCRRRRDGVVVVAADRGLVLHTVQEAGQPRRDASDYFDELGVDLGP